MLIYRHADDVIASRVAGETLLVPIRDRLADMKRIFALDDIPSFIWQQIDGIRSSDEIETTIVGAFDVSLQEARHDLAAFLSELESAGLIVAI